MRFKKMLLAFGCIAALTAATSGAAHAAAHWNVNGSELTGTVETNVSGGPWTLSGTALGISLDIDGEVVHCSGVCINFGFGQIAFGHLKITAAKVTKPTHCTVGDPGASPGTITTDPLSGQVIMDPSNGMGPVFAKFTPEAGTTVAELEFHGEECVLNEFALPIEGSVAGESPNATGVEREVQAFTFGASQQATGGGALTFGGGSTVLSGTADVRLAAGGVFGATE